MVLSIVHVMDSSHREDVFITLDQIAAKSDLNRVYQ